MCEGRLKGLIREWVTKLRAQASRPSLTLRETRSRQSQTPYVRKGVALNSLELFRVRSARKCISLCRLGMSAFPADACTCPCECVVCIDVRNLVVEILHGCNIHRC